MDTEKGKIDGAWELSDNLRELRLRHLEPKRKLLLTIDPSLVALNGATLGKETQKKLPPKIFSQALDLLAAVRYCPVKWLRVCR